MFRDPVEAYIDYLMRCARIFHVEGEAQELLSKYHLIDHDLATIAPETYARDVQATLGELVGLVMGRYSSAPDSQQFQLFVEAERYNRVLSENQRRLDQLKNPRMSAAAIRFLQDHRDAAEKAGMHTRAVPLFNSMKRIFHTVGNLDSKALELFEVRARGASRVLCASLEKPYKEMLQALLAVEAEASGEIIKIPDVLGGLMRLCRKRWKGMEIERLLIEGAVLIRNSESHFHTELRHEEEVVVFRDQGGRSAEYTLAQLEEKSFEVAGALMAMIDALLSQGWLPMAPA